MVEVVGGIVGHGELFHDATGAMVGRDGEGDDLGKCEGGEAVVEDGAGAFRGQAGAPVLGGEAPADFDAGREGSFEGGNVEADEAREVAGGAGFDSPEAEAVADEVGFDELDHAMGFGGSEECRKVLHHAGVGVDAREGRLVSGSPAAEFEPLGEEAMHPEIMVAGGTTRVCDCLKAMAEAISAAEF